LLQQFNYYLYSDLYIVAIHIRTSLWVQSIVRCEQIHV